MAISEAQAVEEAQALDNSLDYVCNNLDCRSQVIGKLRSKGVLTIGDEDRIKAERVSYDKNNLLVITLKNKTSQGSYAHFILALRDRDCNQSHIADRIEKNLAQIRSRENRQEVTTEPKTVAIPEQIAATINRQEVTSARVHKEEPQQGKNENKSRDFIGHPPAAKVDTYAFATSKKALRLIINNYAFKPPRYGSNEDRDTLVKLLKEKCTLAPIVKNDCKSIAKQQIPLLGSLKNLLTGKPSSKSEMLDVLKEFRKNDQLKNVDAVFVCIMSHGNDEGIEDIDGNFVLYKDIVEIFKPKYLDNPDLTGKPRIFIIQACRDTDPRKSKWLYLDGQAMAELIDGGTGIPDAHNTDRDDIMMWLSTGWGQSSYRKPDFSGSYFISAIDNVLRDENNRKDDINTLFRKVRNEVRAQRGSEGGDQDPTMYDKSLHNFYFEL